MSAVSTTAALHQHNLWHYVWKLLRLQLQVYVSGFKHASLRRKIGNIIVVVALLGIVVVIAAASFAVLTVLQSPQLAAFIDPALFLASVPVLVATIAFGGVLLFSFGVLLQALYLAGDMDFLLSAPVPIRAVFVTKLLQAIVPGLGFTLLFGLPVLVGLAAAAGYSLLYYPLVVIVLAATVSAAAGLASLLVMAVARVAPARNVAELLGLVGGIISLLCSQSNLLFRSVSPSQEQAGQAFFGAFAALNVPWSPLAWAGRGLVDIGEGRWLTGIGLTLLTLALAGGVFSVTLVTAERLYYTGWARVQAGTRRKRNGRASRPATARSIPLVASVARLIPVPVRGIAFKDGLVLRRDLRNMSQLLTPMILGVVYSVMLVRGTGQVPAGRGEAPVWFMQSLRMVIDYGNVGIALFVGFSLLTRLGIMSFSQEGKQYWMLKTAPVSATQLLAAKYLVAYVPTLVLSSAFYVIIALLQRGNLALLPYGLVVLALCIAGGAGIALAMGVGGANLDWVDPRRMMSGAAGCLGLLANALYVVTILALFLGPPIIAGQLGWPEDAGRLVGLGLGGVVSIACAIIPLRLVRDRVPRIGEI